MKREKGQKKEKGKEGKWGFSQFHTIIKILYALFFTNSYKKRK